MAEQTGKVVSELTIQREWNEVQAAQKDPAQFRPLYTRYFEPVFRYLFRRTGDESISADLCQQVFLKALQKLHSYRFKGVPFSAWLFRIARNELGQYYRETAKQRVLSVDDQALENIAVELDYSQEQDLQSWMIYSLDELEQEDLELIELRFFEQRPYKEISNILEISESSAKVRVHRILKRLERKLNNFREIEE